MPESENSGWIVSDEELTALTDLFAQFEGAADPLSQSCKEAKNAFHDQISALYFERIEPRAEFKEWTSSQFFSVIRNQCRTRLKSHGSKYLCP
jgi:hypothetical protein